MIYLLDTNAISDLMRTSSGIADWMARLIPNDRVVTSTIVRGEVLFGILRLPMGQRRRELEQASQRLFAALRCEPVPENAAEHYAAVKLSRQKRGLALDENDLWIAATALALGATLVSHDGDFAGIAGLSVAAVKL